MRHVSFSPLMFHRDSSPHWSRFVIITADENHIVGSFFKRRICIILRGQICPLPSLWKHKTANREFLSFKCVEQYFCRGLHVFLRVNMVFLLHQDMTRVVDFCPKLGIKIVCSFVFSTVASLTSSNSISKSRYTST